MPIYPFTPKSTASLTPGDFWPVPLLDGSFACGRVLQLAPPKGPGARSMFYGALMDWRGAAPPDQAVLNGRGTIEQGFIMALSIRITGGQVTGNLPVGANEIELSVNGVDIVRGYDYIRPYRHEVRDALPELSWWGGPYIWRSANWHFLKIDLAIDAQPPAPGI